MRNKWIGALWRFLVNALIMLFSLSCVFPMAWVLNSSLRENKAFMSNNAALALPLYLENYRKAFAQTAFFKSFAFSGILGRAQRGVRDRVVVRDGVLPVTLRVPFQEDHFATVPLRHGSSRYLALLIPIFIQFKYLDMLDKPVTLLMTYVAFGMPFAVILMENYIRSIPREMDEAAYMEGASTTQMMRSVIFPMCVPMLSILTITSFIGAWNEFPFSLVLMSDQNLRTISLAIRMFNQEHTVDYTLYMAALFLTIIPGHRRVRAVQPPHHGGP